MIQKIMKIISIVGARPEFIQSMPISRELRKYHQELLVHTGQHYDYLMSQKFFDELSIPAPDFNLEVGSGTHGKQTAEILIRLEDVLVNEKPDLVIVRGDTNSTLAGALAASKIGIPFAHIEAGERSFDRHMPEEVNRLVADSLADIHFCVSQAAVKHLEDEGIRKQVHLVGDVMLDALLVMLPIANRASDILNKLSLKKGEYTLVTVHRAANTDNPERLAGIGEAINKFQEQVVFPIHPRTRQALNAINFSFHSHVIALEPVGYFDMLVLEENARLIATDSGGVQREAYFMGIPCITLRDETEWVGTVQTGWNQLVGTNTDSILEAWSYFKPPVQLPPIFGDGKASQKIAAILSEQNWL